MSNRILVAYATAAGSTAGVAEAIGKTLVENGAQVDVCPVQEVKDLTPYAAVIVGSAIQEGEWLPEAIQFVKTNQTTLTQKPFAAFLVCMTMGIKDGRFRDHVVQWMHPVRELVRPVSEGYFAGAFDIRKVPSVSDRLKFRVGILTGYWPEGDHRDWEAIRAWTNDLSIQLHA